MASGGNGDPFSHTNHKPSTQYRFHSESEDRRNPREGRRNGTELGTETDTDNLDYRRPPESGSSRLDEHARSNPFSSGQRSRRPPFGDSYSTQSHDNLISGTTDSGPRRGTRGRGRGRLRSWDGCDFSSDQRGFMERSHNESDWRGQDQGRGSYRGRGQGGYRGRSRGGRLNFGGNQQVLSERNDAPDFHRTGRAGGRDERGFDTDQQVLSENSIPESHHFRGRGRGKGSYRGNGGRDVSSIPDASGDTKKGMRLDRDKSWFESVQSISLRDITTLSRLSAENLVIDLFSRMKGFQCTLQNVKTLDKPGIMQSIIVILSKVASTLISSDDSRRKASQILGEAMSERCVMFQFCLKKYISKELLEDTSNTSRYASTISPYEKMRLLSKLLHDLLRSLPSSSWSCLPVDELNSAVEQQMMSNTGWSTDPLNDLIQTVVALRDNAREQYSRQAPQRGKPEEATWDNSEYRDIQILPQWNEVCVAQKPPRLRKNIVTGGYTDWLQYYDIQFRLLREDFVAPLRNGVCDYLNGARGRKLKSVRVYKNVRIMEPVFHDSGICYKIKLDFSYMRRRCNWEHSKRLLYGSLLCLSPDDDNFTDKIYFATVTDRDPKKIAEGNLEVMFQGDENLLAFSFSKASFTMVESCAYFEASQHILRSLQIAEIDTMPFKKYLVLGDCKSVDQPEYLRDSTGYNLSFLLTKEEKYSLVSALPQSPCAVYPRVAYGSDTSDDESEEEETSEVLLNECFVIPRVTNLKSWPTCDQTELDNSQLAGLHMALTQEIAVIQGPPGTGKTYIGLKIVEALLNNKEVWNSGGTKSPILVMCFTNHALDQFLEGILDSPLYSDTTPENLKLVRIGGRCKSEKLSKFSLRNVKRDIYLPRNVLDMKFRAQDRVKEFQSSTSEYATMKSKNKLLSLNDLHGIIDPNHHSALFFSLLTPLQSMFALEIWLGLVDTNDPYFNEWTDPPSPVASSSTAVLEQISTKPPEETTATTEVEGADAADENDENEAGDKSSDDGDSSEDDGALIDIMGEASVELAGRILDDAYANHRDVREVKFFSHNSDYTHFVRDFSNSVRRAVDASAYETGEGSVEVDTSVQFNEIKAMLNLRSIFSAQPLSKSEYSHISDILGLSIQDRHRLYQYWHKQCTKHLRHECEREFHEYNKLCKEQDEARKNADRFALETAEIIGMTTTGAAKYQHILHLVKPRIVIVEEAAEVLESHIVSALNAGTQHLILIGDHKQLRPKPNEYELAKKYNLDVSLFERLIRNSFPHASLEFQHRMSPEIAQLVKPHIYTTLSNHPSVMAYPDIRGVSTNLFFINHHSEEREDENLVSHSNPHEAEYLVNLCRYLLQQRYEHSQITILVTYSGQLLAIRKLMPRNEFEGVRVSTVDNFQGEENDIILLSLVRSNAENSVGFLREENRVCVALSRARMGFYCIGNFTMLREHVPIWNDIMTDMDEKRKLGDGLLLHCSNHPIINFTAKSPHDFVQKSPKGGCLKDCTFRLDCGHVCGEKCHYTNPTHTEYQCRKKCTKACEEGHPCLNLCHQTCKCMVRVTRSMPDCGHDQEMFCYQEPEYLKCISPCKDKCPKGHSCPLRCHEGCKDCVVIVSVTMPVCEHQQWIKCHQDIHNVLCTADCSRTCDNGHPCPKLCHEPCDDCTIPVTKTIPECKHQIGLPCYVKPKHSDCTKPCDRTLPCSHPCRLKCGQDCLSSYCNVKVTIELPDCGHQVSVPCHESHDLSAILCAERCTRKLPCEHDCGLKCSDPCKSTCDAKMNKVWPCGHKLKRPCYQIATPDKYPCNSKCERVLECGHACSKPCGEPCDKKCQKKVPKVYQCGHTVEALCSSTPAQVPCKMLCSYILACGHKCSGKCSECSSKHVHASCTYKIGIRRVCGHLIQGHCSGLQLADSHPGRKEIPIRCCHKTVDKSCFDGSLHTCEQPCDWSCAHHECRKTCRENCERPICDERCRRKLECGHQCHGLCGEPCLSFCPECQLKKFNKKLKSPGKFDEESVYYELPCAHIFSVKFLDDHVQTMTNPRSDVLVTPLQCPVKECFQPFSCSYRYGNHMKRLLSYVEEVNGILKSSSAISSVGITLNRRIKRILDSDDMDVASAEDYNDLSKELRKRWVVINSDQGLICVQYKPMQDITLALCNLKKQKLLSTEGKYLAFVFTEAVGFLQIINDEDTFSSLMNTADYEDTMKEVKTFLSFLSPMTASSSRVSYQVIIDLQNELLRLSLHINILLAKSSRNVKLTQVLIEAEAYLKSISTMNSKIIRSDYKSHVDAISRYIRTSATLDCLKDINDFHPMILKGEWWHCSRGHFYCSPPSILKDVVFNCPHCKLGSYDDFIQLPDQEKIRPAVPVAPVHGQVADGSGAERSSPYYPSGFDDQPGKVPHQAKTTHHAKTTRFRGEKGRR